MEKKKELTYILKYSLVGICNTLLTALIYSIMVFFGINPHLSNFVGYGIGTVNSFLLNKYWTFKTPSNHAITECGKFFLSAFVCWVAQWCVFRVLLLGVNEYWAFIGAFPVYPLFNYLANRIFVFKDQSI